MTSLPPNLERLGCVTEGDAHSWAVFSAERTHRYMLARMWDHYFDPDEATRPLMIFVMQNPSSAGAFGDDPTIRKCVGFARRHKCGGILAVNLAAGIATDPRDLLDLADPIGPHNDEILRIALGNPMMAIAVGAWGRIASKRIRERVKHSMSVAKCARKLWCFGKTADGEPRHPLMLAYDTPLIAMSDGRRFP